MQSLFDLTPTRCGLRPYSADGIILLGRIEKITNLSVNVGPGFNPQGPQMAAQEGP